MPSNQGYGSIQDAPGGYEEGKEVWEDRANPLSKLLFWWCNKIVALGYSRPLEHTDLPGVSKRDDATHLSELFEANWAAEQALPRPSLVRALRKTFGFTFLMAGIPKFISDALGFVGPLAMQQIIVWLNGPDELYVGYLYALALFLGPFLQSVIQNQYFYITFRTGMQVRAALTASVYRKSLKLTSSAKQKKTQGEIVNLQSNDTQRLMDLCPNFHLMWSAPLQIIAALVLLYLTIGSAAFVGLAIMILLVPIQGAIAARLGKLRKALLIKTDSRIKLMNEILQGIRVIKYYAWEQNFADSVNGIRAQEVQVLMSQAYWRALIGFFLIASPVFVSMATFAVYSLSGNVLTPEIIFPALAYFNLLRFPLTFMPILIIALVEAKVSVNRLWEFLTSEETDPIPFQRIGKPGLQVKEGSFVYDMRKMATPVLRDINLEVKSGELVMVVGQVGSGKSTLASTFIGGVQRVSGSVNVNGSVAYAAQQAWIMNQTVRDNILFGSAFDHERYRATIHASCLTQDLAMLPAGDSTEIGEKGINLSGGQRQRVSLARAVYADADIYILDDVLSAVDSHVGKHIFEECIMGTLKKKARLFITHQNHFLPYADRIVVLKQGEIAHQGTYAELTQAGVDFSLLVAKKDSTDDLEASEAEAEAEAEAASESLPEATEPLLEKKKSAALLRRSSTKDADAKETSALRAAKLIETEERETGVVNSKVYWAYILACGGFCMLFWLMFSYVFAEVVRVAGDLWLSLWSTPEEARKLQFNPPPFGSDTEMFFLYIYVLLGVGYSITTLLRNVLTAVAGVNASKRLHDGLFVNLVKAPVSFFDVTPIGRILNRFTKDLDNVDNLLPQTINQFLGTLFICASTFILIAYVTPYFLVALTPIMLLYFFVMQYYRRTSRELQRLDSISRSPIYSYFSETLVGVDTIRAYRVDERFCDENDHRINHNIRAFWMVQVTNRWLSLRLEVLGTLITFSAAIFAVLAKDKINPSLAGLSITYALQVTGFLNWVVRMATQGEAQMNAVERIKYYSTTENEAPWHLPHSAPPPDWPRNPSITMIDMSMRYRVGLEPVLKDITLEIKPREKIGVVGRTGAGKSSLILALFRMVEPYKGKMLIDGIDIGSIGLHDLRSRLAIIPQDPVLFSGTVRLNLDPFSHSTDEEMWTALKQVHLAEAVGRLERGLDSEVAEGGSNWSLGQRQLFCFARALLKKTQILVMDEATSSVDMETDNLIQKTIRTQFADRTILTIAHRLSTIMDSDRVIVMDGGRVSEFDTPAKLLQKEDGHFSSMVAQTGSRTAQLLKKIANKQADVFGNPIADPRA